MPYNQDQLRQIVQWLQLRTPRLLEQGCPLCSAPASGFGVEKVELPGLPTPMLAVACRTCGHIMLFNEDMILKPAAPR